MSQGKLWLIKRKTGRIQGPLSADEIIQLINIKEIEGEETIAEYPGNRWELISTEPLFYDALFQVLSQSDPVSRGGKSGEISSRGSSKSHSHSITDREPSSKTMIVDLSELNSIRKKRKIKTSKQRRSTNSSSEKTSIFKEEELDSSSAEPVESPSFNKKKISIAIGIGVLVLLFFLFDSKESVDQEYITLKAPKKSAPLSPEQVELLVKKGLLQYLRGTVTASINAQDLFLRAIQGNMKDTYSRAMLCLVYLDLWPYTRQDFETLSIINNLTRKTATLNKGGVRSGLCYSVNLIIKGKYKDAKTMVDSSLDGLSEATYDIGSQKLLPMFYYLKALVLFYLNNYAVSLSFLETIQKTLPSWVAPYSLSAEVMEKQNKISQAVSIYKKILELNSKHKVAKIKLGIMEYKYFKKFDKAENILQIALSYPDIAPYQLLSQAHLVLAEIKLKKSNTQQALLHAKKAYSYNPLNKSARNLVLQIGGQSTLSNLRVKKGQLVYEGDQAFLKNEFRRAIRLYEEAFKIDEEKNAMIAVKISKSYKALSFSDQSIQWLKKALNVNSQLMEAYVLMAEYYSEQYDFYNADKILKVGFQNSPRSYELYRGKAYLALQKRDYQGAIIFSKQALKIYESDIESYVILSKAYGVLGDSAEALAYASRGLELDPNSTKTQISYARALGGSREVTAGVDYFKRLVENYPLIIEYRMELAKYLFEDEQYKRALEVVKNIIDIEPKYKEAYFYLGRVLMYERDFKGAYEAFLQAAIFDPSDPQPTFYIGQLRLKERQYPAAEKQFMKVLALNKLYPKAHYYLGKISFMKKNYSEAIRHARNESRVNPKLIAPYILAGEAYEQQNQHLNCSKEYQKAIELAPQQLKFYIKTARCYRKAGYLDLAVKILKKSSEGEGKQKSGDPELYKELGVVYEMRGAYNEANGSYCTYLNLMPTASDRRAIKVRMKKLSKRTGKEVKNCG